MGWFILTLKKDGGSSDSNAISKVSNQTRSPHDRLQKDVQGRFSPRNARSELIKIFNYLIFLVWTGRKFHYFALVLVRNGPRFPFFPTDQFWTIDPWFQDEYDLGPPTAFFAYTLFWQLAQKLSQKKFCANCISLRYVHLPKQKFRILRWCAFYPKKCISPKKNLGILERKICFAKFCTRILRLG